MTETDLELDPMIWVSIFETEGQKFLGMPESLPALGTPYGKDMSTCLT